MSAPAYPPLLASTSSPPRPSSHTPPASSHQASPRHKLSRELSFDDFGLLPPQLHRSFPHFLVVSIDPDPKLKPWYVATSASLPSFFATYSSGLADVVTLLCLIRMASVGAVQLPLAAQGGAAHHLHLHICPCNGTGTRRSQQGRVSPPPLFSHQSSLVSSCTDPPLLSLASTASSESSTRVHASVRTFPQAADQSKTVRLTFSLSSYL